MVALLHPENFEPSAETTPRLRVIEGGAAKTARPVSNLAMVGAAVVVMLFVLFRLVQGAPPASSWEGLSDVAYGVDASAAPVAGPAPVLVDAESTRVVVEGDTLWALALELAPDRDPQEVVGILAARNGGTALQVGQRLVIPAELS